MIMYRTITTNMFANKKHIKAYAGDVESFKHNITRCTILKLRKGSSHIKFVELKLRAPRLPRGFRKYT